jgi:hypothetical protein
LGFLAATPVLGVMPFGAGRIFFLGDTNGIEDVQGVPQRFVNNLSFAKLWRRAKSLCMSDMPTTSSVCCRWGPSR